MQLEQQLKIISSSKSEDQFLVYKFSFGSLHGPFQFSSLVSFHLEIVHPLFLGDHLPFIVISLASQPFTCTSQGIFLDTCPIRTLLEVVEGVSSCEVTVQESFPR